MLKWLCPDAAEKYDFYYYDHRVSMKLNLGCGNDIKEGWLNLDVANIPGVDVIHDLNKLPLPFQSNTFTEVLCQDILEHLDYVDLLREIHRVMKSDGLLKIRVPHFTSRNNFIDPTHRRRFSVLTFQFFVKESLHDRSYYFDFYFSKLASVYLSFEKGPYFYNRPIEWLINKSRNYQSYFEATVLRSLFPAENIEIALIK